MINIINYKKMTDKSDILNQFLAIKKEIFA